jgi:hypothetical protein
MCVPAHVRHSVHILVADTPRRRLSEADPLASLVSSSSAQHTLDVQLVGTFKMIDFAPPRKADECVRILDSREVQREGVIRQLRQ